MIAIAVLVDLWKVTMRHANAEQIFKDHEAEMKRIDQITDMHELWYEWLKTTDEKDWSERVTDWFGDCSIPYAEWRKDHEENFHDNKTERFFFHVIEDVDDYESWSDKSDPESELVVFINMHNPKRELVKAFRQLLKERHPGKRGKPKIDQWAEFPLAMYPEPRVIESLKKMLKVYRLKQTGLHLYEIGELLRFTEDRTEFSDKTHSMGALVGRYVTWYKTLQENVAKGIFPKYKKEKGHPK